MAHSAQVARARGNKEMSAALIEAAARLIATEGAGALTLRRVADEVGTSTMAIYTHFGGMPELRRAVRQEASARLGERRKAGQPDAGPLPGQYDQSKPHVVLPPGVQQLLDQLRGTARQQQQQLPRPRSPRVGDLLGQVTNQSNGSSSSSSTDAQLLDFLLGP